MYSHDNDPDFRDQDGTSPWGDLPSIPPSSRPQQCVYPHLLMTVNFPLCWSRHLHVRSSASSGRPVLLAPRHGGRFTPDLERNVCWCRSEGIYDTEPFLLK